MTLYLGEAQISSNTPSVLRNIGEIVQSAVPLNDGALHLLDGSLINGSGVYSDFVNYMTNQKSGIRIEGDLTDTAGVLSGFSTLNYAYIPCASLDNTEYVIKFTTGADVTTVQNIISDSPLIWLRIDSGYLTQYVWASDTNTNIQAISANTTYWIKIVVSGTTKNFYISTDGSTYTATTTASVTDANSHTNTNYPFTLGLKGNSYADPFLGSIDLTGSYIKQGDDIVWNGANYGVLGKYCTDENVWQKSITSYGVCGKFVVDTISNTVRLPKVTGIVEGTTDPTALGDLIEQFVRLPNITGKANSGFLWNAIVGSQGALENKTSTISSATKAYSSGSDPLREININASRSSSVYSGDGTDTKIQPQALKVLYYIVLATSSKTEIQVDIDDIATDLNGKADVDLTNVNNSGTSTGAGWAMPSSSYDTLTLGSSGTDYIAPANGYFCINKQAGNPGFNPFIALTNRTSGNMSIEGRPGANGTVTIQLFLPAKKGDTVRVSYDSTGTLNYFRFVYAEGSKSEA